MNYLIYIAAALGAMAVYLTLPHGRSHAKLGGLLGAVTLGGLLVVLLTEVGADQAAPGFYYYTFTAIAAAAGLRMITHTRPVYAALYFVIVILSTTGMLVLLEAEFMAFAMVIIYAGAILVTYMFVIMLATLPATPGQPETQADYDRTSREPLLAVVMGFVLLGALGSVFFGPAGTEKDPPPIARTHQVTPWDSAANISGKVDTRREADRREIEARLRNQDVIAENEYVHQVDLAEGQVGVRPGPSYEGSIGARTRWVEMDANLLRQFVGNIDHIGLNLFQSHTLGIELAGVILLLSMVGAIVIARQRLPGAMEAAETTRG